MRYICLLNVSFMYVAIAIVTAYMCTSNNCIVACMWIACRFFQLASHLAIYICNTSTPKIKGKSQCINVILHWLWNANEIYAHLRVRISN